MINNILRGITSNGWWPILYVYLHIKYTTFVLYYSPQTLWSEFEKSTGYGMFAASCRYCPQFLIPYSYLPEDMIIPKYHTMGATCEQVPKDLAPALHWQYKACISLALYLIQMRYDLKDTWRLYSLTRNKFLFSLKIWIWKSPSSYSCIQLALFFSWSFT